MMGKYNKWMTTMYVSEKKLNEHENTPIIDACGNTYKNLQELADIYEISLKMAYRYVKCHYINKLKFVDGKPHEAYLIHPLDNRLNDALWKAGWKLGLGGFVTKHDAKVSPNENPLITMKMLKEGNHNGIYEVLSGREMELISHLITNIDNCEINKSTKYACINKDMFRNTIGYWMGYNGYIPEGLIIMALLEYGFDVLPIPYGIYVNIRAKDLSRMLKVHPSTIQVKTKNEWMKQTYELRNS